ncbi:hypothetical protein FUAX_48300 (plasmid) [Fulvitalea axinellae]|uniref:T9SS type A sorting domain-containing protein n=1 Tax=Fulvitalea axinellae TaxID=1182444 RepID=A0AAU9D8U4_9BACT|nr:hypothetical protein FUAX_48300 [Fulvitalea axinellae]
MKTRLLFIMALSFIMSPVFSQNKQERTAVDRPLSYRISEDWMEVLKNQLDGENWRFKSADELLKRKESPRFKKGNENHVHMMGNAEMEYHIQHFGTTDKNSFRHAWRCASLDIVDFRGNNLKGELLDDPIWTYKSKSGSYTYESGRFNPVTEFLFSHNQISKVTVKLYGQGSPSTDYVKKVAFDHNGLETFEPPYPSEGNVGYRGIYNLQLQNNKIRTLDRLKWEDHRIWDRDFSNWKKGDIQYYGFTPHLVMKADTFRIENNYLNFEQLKYLKSLTDGSRSRGSEPSPNPDFQFIYFPQKALGEEIPERTVNAGEAIELEFSLPDDENKYRWELNGEEIPLSEGKDYRFIMDSEQAGVYRCLVTNEALPKLTVKSTDFAVFMSKDGNKAPTDISITNNHMPPYAFRWAVVGDLISEDPDGDKVFFRLVGDMDGNNSSFRIKDGRTLVSSEELFNHHFLTEYRITVEAYDVYGGKFQKELVIQRGNPTTNPPTNFVMTNVTIDENKIGEVGQLKLSGVKDGTFGFSLPEALDNRFFTIEGEMLKTKIPLNYEVQRYYNIRVNASSTDGSLTIPKDFRIEALNINDAPRELVISTNRIEVGKRKGTYIGTLVATDDDPEDINFKYEIVSNDFVVDNNVQIKNKRKFLDSDIGDKTLRVTVTDPHGAKTELPVIIQVVPVPTEGPSILINNNSIQENKTGIVGAFSVDQGGEYAYSLVSGDGAQHNSKFEIDGKSLKIKSEADYEGENIMMIRVKAEGAKTIEQKFVIHIQNVNEAPETLGLNNFQIKATDAIGTDVAKLILKDIDGDRGSFKLEDKHDAAYFKIEGDRLILNKTVDKTAFVISIIGSDGEYSVDKEFAIISDFDSGDKTEARIFAWNDFSIPAGKSIELTAETNSDGALTYQIVSGAEFATLNGSTLNGVKKGTVEIKAIVAGTDKFAQSSKTITVSVLEEGSKQTATISDWENLNAITGEVMTLGAYSDSDGKITYEIVAGAEFVTIEKNKLTAVKAGVATVKASVAETDNYLSAEKTIEVTINAKGELIPAVISNFSFESAIPLSQGTLTLGAYSNSDAKIEYQITRGAELASINGSLLTLVKDGEISVRAYVNATEKYTAAEMSVNITLLKDGDLIATEILGLEDIDINENSPSFALSGYSESPSKIKYEIVQGEGVVEIDGVNVRPLKAGLASIKASVDPHKLYKAAEKVIVLRVHTVTNVEDSSNSIEMYPNPTSGILNINSYNAKGKTEVIIYSNSGTELIRKSEDSANGEISVDLESLPSGIYNVKIVTEKGLWTKKLIKK